MRLYIFSLSVLLLSVPVWAVFASSSPLKGLLLVQKEGGQPSPSMPLYSPSLPSSPATVHPGSFSALPHR